MREHTQVVSRPDGSPTRSTARPLGSWVVAAAVAVAQLASPGVAVADANKLWSERSTASAPLAQVPDFRALAEALIPSVVSIQVEQRVKMGGGMQRGGPGAPQDPYDFFHRYFGGEIPREFHNHGLGTGFVIDTSGLLLTNYHVVEDAESIEVTFTQPDGSDRKVPAKVLGTAPKYDVALIKTEDKVPLPITYLGDSDRTQIGDWVMAVGNPFGLSHSVSVGIISAKERRDIAPSGRQGLYNFLQTDASINPGNSGGPLVNMRGEVIGINSAINASGSGIGFAIPINMVKEMLPDLRSKGKYTRSWIGIKIQALSPELAQSYGLSRTTGALVAEILPHSPAEAARLKEGDIILQFDNKDLRSSSDLPLFASMAGVGKKVPIKVWRDGKELALTVQLSEFPDDPSEAAAATPQEGGLLGMRVADVTPQLAQELGLDASQGVVVRDVEPSGPAARAGLRPGDLVVSINGAPADSARSVADATHKAKSGDMLRFKILRQGAGQFIALRKP